MGSDRGVGDSPRVEVRSIEDLKALLSDENYREGLAEASYYRERVEEAAADREHDTDEDTEYMCLSWDSLSDFSQRPYRTAVAQVCDTLLAAAD